MPARVLHGPLRVEFAFPDGKRWVGLVGDDTGNPALAADLAAALVQLVHPVGTVASRGTAERYLASIRHMIGWLDGRGFTGGADRLRRIDVIEFWLAARNTHVGVTKKLLSQVPGLDVGLVDSIAGRRLKQVTRTTPYRPYTEGEWQRLEQALLAVVGEAERRHRQALAWADAGPHLGAGGEQSVAWLLAQHGPVGVDELRKLARRHGLVVCAGGVVERIRDALFPGQATITAFRLLFGMYSGIVSDGIASMTMSGLTKAGSRTALVSYVKSRTGPESVAVSARAFRVVERWLELSAPMRALAPEPVREAVWIVQTRRWRDETGPYFQVFASTDKPPRDEIKHRLVRDAVLVDDAGSPLVIHPGRIRATYHNRLARKSWTGRTTIDPNHSARVEGDHYASTLTPAQADAVDAIIEDGQADLLRRAAPPIVLSHAEAADIASSGQAERVAALAADSEQLRVLLSGDADVFTASCSDQYAGLHGPAGKPCPARPWVCLLCPLALFLPRHAGNLLRLKAFFARQSRQMTAGQFLAVFGPYADRLDREVLPLFDPAVLHRAAAGVADDDAEIPVRPEEATR